MSNKFVYDIISKISIDKNMHINDYISKIKEYYKKINKNIIRNMLFYKNLSFNIKFSNINKIFYSSSPSIIKHPYKSDMFVINTRVINYYLDVMGKSNNNGKCITVNKISVLDKFFNEVKFKYLFADNFNSKYVGIEDIRLFNFNNELYFIGSMYNPNNNRVEIVSNKYMLWKKFQPITIKPSFKSDFNWEKNWVFFNNNNEINIIYKWYPIYICKIDYITHKLNLIKSIENLPIIFNNFRGSTNGIHYDNRIWFIVHQQNTVINYIKSYVHNFVVFDKNMNLIGYSESFKFENKLIEFCIGMELTDKNNFVITYSTLDSTSKLVIFSPNYVSSLINYI
jgi:hypothetical protein